MKLDSVANIATPAHAATMPTRLARALEKKDCTIVAPAKALKKTLVLLRNE